MPSKKPKKPVEKPVSEESADEEDGGFVVDPDQIFDLLPQPFRLVDKLLTLIFDQTWEIIEDIEEGRDQRRSKAQLPIYDCGRNLLQLKEISCMFSFDDTNITLVAHSLGLTAVDVLLGQVLATHEEEQERTKHISACSLQNGFCFICTLNEKGMARIYCYSGDQLQLVKVLNEQDNLIATVLEISPDGSYLGVGWKVPERESWLELYKIPKDSWIKEIETFFSQQRAQKATFSAEVPQESVASLESSSFENTDAVSVHSSSPHSRPSSVQGAGTSVAVSLTKLTTVLKVKPPPEPTPCHSTSSAAALKAIDGECSVIATGTNHILMSQYFQHSEETFTALHESQLSYLKEGKQVVERTPHFHFLGPSRLIPGGLDATPGKPSSVAVRWTDGTQLFLYSLHKSSKDSEQKPDVVWPCTDSIVVSVTSDCASLLAFGTSSGTVVVWDVYRGMLLKVVSVTERGSIELLHFLPCAVAPVIDDEQSAQHLSPGANLVVSCDDGTFGILRCGSAQASSFVPLLDKSSKELEIITSVLTLHQIPQVIVAGKDTGHVTMYDVQSCSAICHVSLPGELSIDTNVLPQIAAEGKVLVVKGKFPEEDEDAVGETDCVVSFVLRSLPALDWFMRNAVAARSYLFDNTIETRLQSMILDRVASQGSRQCRLEDRWSSFQNEFKKMQAEKVKRGNTSWFHTNPSVYSYS